MGMANAKHEAAVAAVKSAEADLLGAWRVWATAQGEQLRSRLLAEGKHTVVKQHSVTVGLGDKVPELKASLEALALKHGELLKAWGVSLEEIPDDDDRKIWTEHVNQARVEFGELFTALGYEPTELKSSRDWVRPEDWEFYVPETGTARGRYLPRDFQADEVLEQAQRAYDDADFQLRDIEDDLEAQHAKDLWDAS